MVFTCTKQYCSFIQYALNHYEDKNTKFINTLNHPSLTVRHSISLLASFFYRAMHFSAKRGIAIACRLSVCPSDCLSV